MTQRYIATAMLIVVLGASTNPIPPMWHLDCPVVALWCSPPLPSACRTIRPNDEYDFLVKNFDNHKQTATVEMLTMFPYSFLVPSSLNAAGDSSLTPSTTPQRLPMPFPTNAPAAYTHTAAYWNIESVDRNASASFILQRASLRLVVMTETPDTEVDWEGTCRSVNNKLLTTPPPKS
jgi:hypothetical protein